MSDVTTHGPVAPGSESRVALGVARAVAARLNLDPVAVRLVFVGACVVAPPLALAYLLAAPFTARMPRTPVQRLRGAEPGRLAGTLGLLLIEIPVVLATRELTVGLGNEPAAVVLTGQVALTLLWRPVERSGRWSWLVRSADPAVHSGSWARRLGVLRVGLGLSLCLLAAQLAFAASFTWADLARVQAVLWPLLALVVGIGLIVVPPLARLSGQFTGERRERIQADERARLAAHLHDSVLQTLTLIQRADDPGDMASLARKQERDLRDWLYGSRPAASATGFRERLAALAAEMEDRYRWRVELIVVGDRPVGIGEEELLAATREAIVNAARHSGAPHCDLFAECRPEEVRVFIRDRGAGFDPDRVGADRRGIADSLLGRMQRLGGEARVRSVAGHGTEVALTLPLPVGASA